MIISYPTSASGIIVLLKTPTKYGEFFPTLFVKTTDFQLFLNFEQTPDSYHIWRAWYNGSYTTMAEPIRALELHYPMIQFLMNKYSPVILGADPEQIHTKGFSSKICQNWRVIEHIKSLKKSELGNMVKFSKTPRSSFHNIETRLEQKVQFYWPCIIIAYRIYSNKRPTSN